MYDCFTGTAPRHKAAFIRVYLDKAVDMRFSDGCGNSGVCGLGECSCIKVRPVKWWMGMFP